MDSKPDAQPSAPKPKRRRVVVLKWSAGAIIVLLVAHTALNLHSMLMLRRARADLAGDGRPMHMDELAPARLAPAQNAAVDLRAAFGLLTDDPTETTGTAAVAATVEDWTWPSNADAPADAQTPAATPEPGVIDDMRRRLVGLELTPVFDRLERAIAKPHANFDLNYSDGFELQLPHLAPFRQGARLMAVRARIRAMDGDMVGALDDVARIARLGRLLETEATTISQLVRIAVLSISTRTLHRILADNPEATLPTEQAEALGKILAAAREAEPAVTARIMDAERIIAGQDCFEQFLAGDRTLDKLALLGVQPVSRSAGNRFAAKLYASYLCRPMVRMDYCKYLRTMAMLRRSWDEPYGNATAELVAERIKQLPKWAILSNLLLPGLPRVRDTVAKVQTNLSLAELALAVVRYRDQHGRYPADLQELGLDAAPVDPCSGQSLHYRVDDDGCIFYSVATNRLDDGGSSEQDADGPLDLVWRLPDAASATNDSSE